MNAGAWVAIAIGIAVAIVLPLWSADRNKKKN